MQTIDAHNTYAALTCILCNHKITPDNMTAGVCGACGVEFAFASQEAAVEFARAQNATNQQD
jgi:formate-dependent nitrite reductase cytochrome c552 subunit